MQEAKKYKSADEFVKANSNIDNFQRYEAPKKNTQIEELKSTLSSLRRREWLLTSEDAIKSNTLKIKEMENKLSKLKEQSPISEESFWIKFVNADWDEFYPIKELGENSYLVLTKEWKEIYLDVPIEGTTERQNTRIGNRIKTIRDLETSDLSIQWIKDYVSKKSQLRKIREEANRK